MIALRQYPGFNSLRNISSFKNILWFVFFCMCQTLRELLEMVVDISHKGIIISLREIYSLGEKGAIKILLIDL